MLDGEDFDLELIGEVNVSSERADSIAQSTAVYSPLIRLYIFVLFMFQTLFRISDNALDVLFKFLSMFLKTVGQKISSLPQSFVDCLPNSLNSAPKGVENNQNKFDRYVCCPSCHSLYHIRECVLRGTSGKLQSNKCSFIRFPSHPQPQHRKPCDTQLMKEVKCRSKGVSFYPRFVYCYKSVIESLQQMLEQPDFFEKCEQWRKKQHKSGVYADVYDGEIWKQFLVHEGNPFLSLPGNYAFQLNVDWFNPFKHTQHSEGAIYLSVLNLPRKER